MRKQKKYIERDTDSKKAEERQEMQTILWRGEHKGRTSSGFSHLEPDLEGCSYIADTDPAVLGPGATMHTF